MLKNPAVAKRKAVNLLLTAVAINIGVVVALVLFYKEMPWLDAVWFGADSLYTIALLGVIMYLLDDRYLNKIMLLPLGYEIVSIVHDVIFPLTGEDGGIIWSIGLVVYFFIILIWLARAL